jgi:hypothetical protein
MISDFIFPGGRLCAPKWLPTEDLPDFGLNTDVKLRDDPYLATMKLEYGPNRYWEGEDLVKQVILVALPIFESAFPGCEAVISFRQRH